MAYEGVGLAAVSLQLPFELIHIRALYPPEQINRSSWVSVIRAPGAEDIGCALPWFGCRLGMVHARTISQDGLKATVAQFGSVTQGEIERKVDEV